MGRLHNLDYLRGLAALGIMIYHYSSWTVGHWDSEHVMGRIGLYGVSIFYVLSGLTLCYVYLDRIDLSIGGFTKFFKKRFFRIYPLLWLTTVASIVLLMKIPDAQTLFLNFSGLFGIFEWDNYIATGAWSIGNELVFYLFVPIFIIFIRKSRPFFYVLTAILFGLFLYFCFFVLEEREGVSRQEWFANYINPLNQVFYFLVGFIMGWAMKNLELSKVISSTLIFTGATLFVLYPVDGDLINVGSGLPRLVMTLSCLLICLGFYKATFSVNPFVHRLLSLLGEASYSLYLLHPIVFNFMFLLNKHVLHLPSSIIVSISVIMTLIVSYLVYNYFEKFFMRLAKSSSIQK